MNTLSALPGGDLRGLGRRFQRSLARRNATPWLLATTEDRRWPTTEGGRPGLPTRLAQRYVDLVLAAIADDAVIGQSFFAVLHLIEPPPTLLRPRVIMRVLRNAARSVARPAKA